MSTTENPTATVHPVARGTYHVGGFDLPEGGTHTDRVKQPYENGVRLLVRGSKNSAGFGLCATDADQFHNLGPGRGRAAGPDASAYGLASVIDNHGGTGADIDRARAAGLLLEVEIGDRLEIDGRLWEIGFYTYGTMVDRHNIKLTLVEDGSDA